MQIQLTFGSKGLTDEGSKVFVQHILCSHGSLGQEMERRPQRCSQSSKRFLFMWRNQLSPQGTEASEDGECGSARTVTVAVMKGEERGQKEAWRLLSPAWAGRSQLYAAEPEDLSRRAQSTQQALCWRRWEEGCPETSLYGDGGCRGRLAAGPSEALNVVRFLSAGFRGSPLSFMFCSPSTARQA